MQPILAGFVHRTLAAAGIGGWEVDSQTGRLSWSRRTFEIPELPTQAVPGLQAALDFYPPESRRLMGRAVQDAIDYGARWDLDMAFVTARGYCKCVRARGRIVQAHGKTIALTGTLEDA